MGKGNKSTSEWQRPLRKGAMKEPARLCPETLGLLYNGVSVREFPLPGIAGDNLLILRPDTLCWGSEMIFWQHGPSLCKQTHKIMSPPGYRFPSSQTTSSLPQWGGERGRDPVNILPLWPGHQNIYKSYQSAPPPFLLPHLPPHVKKKKHPVFRKASQNAYHYICQTLGLVSFLLPDLSHQSSSILCSYSLADSHKGYPIGN